MEAASPVFETKGNEQKKYIKEFEIESDNQLYTIKVGKTSNEAKILFLVSPKNNSLLSYEAVYSLKELYDLNKSFQVFSSIEDLINVFDDMVKNKKIILEKDKKDDLNLQLGIMIFNILGKEDKILFDLKLNELDNKDINKNLLGKIIELEKKLFQKDEEIKLINKKYKELEETTNKKLIELEKRIEKLEKKDEIIFKSDFLTINDIDFILKRFNQGNKNIKMDLIYKCDKTNGNPQNFHEKCDGKKNVLVFIETTKNVKFGGFTSIGFNSQSKFTVDNKTFIFSIDKRLIYNVKQNKDAIYCLSNYGPCFCGNDEFNIYIYGTKFLEEKCHTSKAKNNSFNINYDYELNNSEYEFYIKNLEIFQILIN